MRSDYTFKHRKRPYLQSRPKDMCRCCKFGLAIKCVKNNVYIDIYKTYYCSWFERGKKINERLWFRNIGQGRGII